MTKHAVCPVILCGGGGSRLWPLSRTGFPKQFLCLTGENSLFQLAARRLNGIGATDITVSAPIVVTNEEYRFLALEQLREINIEVESLLLEPASRNTAPALTLAALHALESGGDPVLAVSPADQAIRDTAAFIHVLQSATRVTGDVIVVFGIEPDCPETSFGYIEAERPLQQNQASPVRSFTEKPNAVAARSYLEAGSHYWNSGLFVLKASTWMAAIEAFRPDIAATTGEAWEKRSIDGKFIRPDMATFSAVPSDSIDYAVMEKCPGGGFPVSMMELDAGWSDLGAWDAVWKALPKDVQGNAHFGDVIAVESRNTLVHASGRFVGLIGMEDVAVVETQDAVLVASAKRVQQVRAIVDELSRAGRAEPSLHRKVHRPWGWYDSLDADQHFKVKRVMVKPGASLSLQKHRHRAEHWIVVRGTAEITCGERTHMLNENQSTYIPPGEVHRIVNPGTTPLEIIEVQTGNYLGEDDIVRFDDVYGRSTD